MRKGLLLAASCAALICGVLAGSVPANAEPAKRLRSAADSAMMPFLVAAGKTWVAALINADGSIASSKGVASVIHNGTGDYCVILNSNIPSATAIPVMSFNYDSSADFDVFVVYVALASCATNGITVYTYQADAGGHTGLFNARQFRQVF